MIDFWDHSTVNFIVLKLLTFLFSMFPKKKYVIYVPPPQVWLQLNFSSNAVINNILYRRANLEPIAALRFCLKVNTLFLKTTSANSGVEVLTSFSSLKSSHLRRVDRPSLCGMLGYKSTTSTVYKIMLSGQFDKKRSFLKKSFSSFI